MNNRFVAILALVMSILVCNLPGTTEILTGEPSPTASSEPTASPIPDPTTSSEPTATATPQETTCVSAGGIPVPDPLPNTEALPDALASYLTAGGSVTALRQAMRDSGHIGEDYGLVNDTLDVNADGINDIVITFRRVEVEPFGARPPGGLVLYLCDDGVYTPVVEHNIEGEDIDLIFVPEVLATRDINGVPGAELLFYDGNCGAHTCYNTLHGYTTDGAGGVKPLFDEPFNGPYPSFSLEERDSDEATEIVVDGGAIGSVGAGPQRTFRYIYDWNGTVYTQAEVEQTSPSHPVHVVIDADDLLLKGDLDAALAEYERSYTDESLDLFGGEDVWPLDALEAYARYRRVLIHLLQGDLSAAQAENSTLQAEFSGTDGADLAQTLLEAYEVNGEQIEPACEAVVASIPADWQANTPLNQFGYANTYYEPSDMCPFTGS